MKSQIKKSLCLVLVLCMVLATASGCKGKGDTPATTDPNINPTENLPSDIPEQEVPDPNTSATDDTSTTSDIDVVAPNPDVPTTQPDDIPVPGDTTPTTEGDPWSLTPAPSIDTLLQNAFPAGKTIHANMMMNLSMELAIDPSALGSDEEVNMDDFSATMYMNASIVQDSDTAYVDGTVATYAAGENESQVQRVYTEKTGDTTATTYTYSPDGVWVKQDTEYTGGFGLESMLDINRIGDTTLFDIQTTETEYIITGTTHTNITNMLGEALGDDTSTAPELNTTMTIRIDRQTGEVRSVVAATDPFLMLFFNVKGMTIGMTDIRFDDVDVLVPADIKSSAIEATADISAEQDE